MPLKFTCTACNTMCHIGEEFAGRQVRCGKCSAVQTVPVPEPPAEEEIPDAIMLEPINTEPPPIPKRLSRRAEREDEPEPRRSRHSRRDRQPQQQVGTNVLLILGIIGGVAVFFLVGVVVVGLLAWRAVALQNPPPNNVAIAIRPMEEVPPHQAEDLAANEARRKEQEAQREQARQEQQARREEQWRQDKLRREEEDQRRVQAWQEQQRLEEEARKRQLAEKAAKVAQDYIASLSKPLADVKIPAAQQGDAQVAEAWTNDNGLLWSKLKLGKSPTGACWAADGKSFFALSKDGILRQVSYPDLKELRRVAFDQECDELAWCQRGLLITLIQLQELWIVDPDTLSVSKRYGVTQLSKAMTGPQLDVAYIMGRSSNISDRKPLVRISLKDGKFDSLESGRSEKVKSFGYGGDPRYSALSADGKYLIVDSGNLVRFRIEGLTLTADSVTSERMGGGHKAGICISPDSEWVCFPTGGGNDGLNYATYIYRTSDLSRPAFTMRQGAYPEIVGYDPVSKRFFSQNYDTPLLVFDVNGTQRGAHKFGRVSGSHNIRQYAAHPKDGIGLLVRAKEEMILVQFAEKK